MTPDLLPELLAILDGWSERRVTVRVVARDEELIAVSVGTLLARTTTKGAATFWPLASDESWPGLLEQPGIYVHPQLLTEIRLRPGKFVVDFTQGGVTVNVRLLDAYVV